MDFLVRHCMRAPGQAEDSLTRHRSQQVEVMAGELEIRGGIPDLILVSKQAHGPRTADSLAPQFASAARLIELDALTPKCRLGVSPD
jgi:phosphohistidine phosphatase SixA